MKISQDLRARSQPCGDLGNSIPDGGRSKGVFTKDSEAYRRGGEKRGSEDQSDVGAIGKRKILSASAVMERDIIRFAF